MIMKRIIFCFLALSFAHILRADDFRFGHGPYLQCMETNEVTVFFTTNKKAFSWVELDMGDGSAPKRFYTTTDGLVHAYDTRNAIRITGLAPGTEYRYRLVSKEMKEFHPYKIVYGDSIASHWETFSTFPENPDSCSFVVVNDIHDNATKLRTLLGHSSLDSADAVLYLGDMISYSEHEETPYRGFIDASVDLFARNKPFICVRGNHETRGNMARLFGNYVGRTNGKYYGIHYFGNTAIVIIDTGEDKPDTHPVYGGINRFDEYRTHQAQWLKEQMKTKRFRKTKNRIVLMHIPPAFVSRSVTAEDHAIGELRRLFMPIFKQADIDLVLSGHIHNHFFFDTNEAGNSCPIVINDNKSVMDISSGKQGIRVRITTLDGKTTFDKTF